MPLACPPVPHRNRRVGAPLVGAHTVGNDRGHRKSLRRGAPGGRPRCDHRPIVTDDIAGIIVRMIQQCRTPWWAPHRFRIVPNDVHRCRRGPRHRWSQCGRPPGAPRHADHDARRRHHRPHRHPPAPSSVPANPGITEAL